MADEKKILSIYFTKVNCIIVTSCIIFIKIANPSRNIEYFKFHNPKYVSRRVRCFKYCVKLHIADEVYFLVTNWYIVYDGILPKRWRSVYICAYVT